ncbi:MAG: hypothetical protein A3E81_01210 [Gammaproteobacteria bacterium RIFCSPHIGHO2_12_FULL_36_30]|nr:MAG: hypothetical protein A3E81_01210 [Gammaproteobacteria bacterium RIFCSPHIGHO2_12_FULL_36_30]
MLSIGGLATLTLTGCMVGPDFKQLPPPKAEKYTYLPVPQKTVSASQNPNAGKSQHLIAGRDLQGDWWTIFHSTSLNKLILEGLQNNQDLVAAKAALREANYTLYAQVGGLLLPSVNFNGGAQQVQTNGLTFGTNTLPTSTFNIFNASFGASYLLDIWGASRRQIEALAAQADYERYTMIATYLTLTTNIATTAITIASLQDQIKATEKLIIAQKKILNITRKQFSVGGVSYENVLTQQTLLAQTEATMPPLRQSLSQEQHALAVLIGKQTNVQKPLKIALNKIILPKNIPVSLPSKIITQRPDIQASEALLHAASANVGVATANLLPQVTLSAAYGWQSSTTTNFFSAQNEAWNYGAALLQPIFHGGQLILQRKAAIAALDQARAQYEQTVLQAFKNIADALRAIQFDAYEFKDQALAEKTAYATLILTEKQYQVGGQNYLAVLNAQEQYQQIVLSRVKAQAARYTDTAALYQTLGGGWWNNKIINNYGVIAHRSWYH